MGYTHQRCHASEERPGAKPWCVCWPKLWTRLETNKTLWWQGKVPGQVGRLSRGEEWRCSSLPAGFSLLTSAKTLPNPINEGAMTGLSYHTSVEAFLRTLPGRWCVEHGVPDCERCPVIRTIYRKQRAGKGIRPNLGKEIPFKQSLWKSDSAICYQGEWSTPLLKHFRNESNLPIWLSSLYWRNLTGSCAFNRKRKEDVSGMPFNNDNNIIMRGNKATI